MMAVGLSTRKSLTRSFTWVLLRCHFSLGCEGVNTDTSLPSSSRMLELSCRMTCGTEAGHGAGSEHLAGSAGLSNPLVSPAHPYHSQLPSLP